MKTGYHDFANGLQAWSFAAVRAPFDAVRAWFADQGAGVEAASTSSIETGIEVVPTESFRQTLLLAVDGRPWVSLVCSAHWIDAFDVRFVERVARDLSREFDTVAVSGSDDDFAAPAPLLREGRGDPPVQRVRRLLVRRRRARPRRLRP